MNRFYIPYSPQKRIISGIILCLFAILLLMLSCWGGVDTPNAYGLISVAIFDLLYCYYKLHHGKRLLFSNDGIFEEHYRWFNEEPYFTRTIAKIEEVKKIVISMDFRYNNAIDNFVIFLKLKHDNKVEVRVLDYFFLLDHSDKYGEEFDSLLWHYCSCNHIALEIKKSKGSKCSSLVLEERVGK